IMKRARMELHAILDAGRKTFRWSLNRSIGVLKYIAGNLKAGAFSRTIYRAGYTSQNSAITLGRYLKDSFGRGKKQAERALKDAGYKATRVARAIRDAYGFVTGRGLAKISSVRWTEIRYQYKVHSDKIRWTLGNKGRTLTGYLPRRIYQCGPPWPAPAAKVDVDIRTGRKVSFQVTDSRGIVIGVAGDGLSVNKEIVQPSEGVFENKNKTVQFQFVLKDSNRRRPFPIRGFDTEILVGKTSDKSGNLRYQLIPHPNGTEDNTCFCAVTSKKLCASKAGVTDLRLIRINEPKKDKDSAGRWYTEWT
ncbi:MAG TPA: hypothetical protein DDZ83_07910, partial [Nitrospinae bacterium]|nr:hypothetical protein [Nitrospinota bacterium]